MKKAFKFAHKLKIKKSSILLLSPEQQNAVVAGDELATNTRPYSYACPPPFNAPPYFDPTKL